MAICTTKGTTMSNVLLITERENAAINPPTYFVQDGSVMYLSGNDVRSFVLHAEQGVTYALASTGNPSLELLISGPGLAQPMKTTIGGLATFSAPSRGVYTITVQSPETDNPNLGKDRPHHGSFTLDVYSNVFDDVGLVQPVGTLVPSLVATFGEAIDAPTYNLNGAGAKVSVKTYDTDTFTISADAGDYYGLLTKGATGLKVTISGPGTVVTLEDGTKMDVPIDGTIGDTLGFRATVGGVYTVTVQSEVVKTSVSAEDRPNSGNFSIEVMKSDGEDIDRIEVGSIFTTNNQLKGRIGTASDADQLYGTIPAGASTFVAAFSKDVKDITIEMFESGTEDPIKAVTAKDGMALLAFSSPASATYELLLRSGSYYQTGNYEAFGGQRFAPKSTLAVAKPGGDTLTFNDSSNREVWGWSGNTTITTGGGNDVLVATVDGNDRLNSGAGDDEIYLAGGLDYADGGLGRDVAYFTGIKLLTSFNKSGGNLVLSGTLVIGGTKAVSTTATLANIEYVQFLDTMYDVAKDRFLSGIIHFDRAGDQAVKGSKSVDSMIFDGKRSEFSITIAGQDTTIVDKTGHGGANHTQLVEKLMFDDMGVQTDFVGANGKSGTFNEMGTAGRAAATILTVWGPGALADKELAGLVLDYFADGMEAEDAANIIVGTGMLADAAGGDSNAKALDYLYKNVVGVAPTKAEHDWYMKLFDDPNFSQVDLLELAFDQPSLVSQLTVMGIWTHGLEYIAPPLQEI